MDGVRRAILLGSALVLGVLCSPRASLGQERDHREVGPSEASALPVTLHPERTTTGPAARLRFSDARPIGKAETGPVSVDESHRHIAQTSSQSEPETLRPTTPTPANVESSGSGPNVRSAAGKGSATAEKQWPQGAPKYKAPMPPEPPDLRALVTRFVFGTVAVLVACVACLYLARRWLSNNAPAGKADGRMKLVATVSLSNRSSLQLVDIEGQKVLVGSDVSGIKTVTPLPDSFVENLEQVDEAVGDDGERFPFDSLTRQVS